ncbi:MAG: hypothetical protein R6V32_11255 [Bacteroidales bacterium]
MKHIFLFTFVLIMILNNDNSSLFNKVKDAISVNALNHVSPDTIYDQYIDKYLMQKMNI